MGAEEGRHHPDRKPLRDAPDDAEVAQLLVERQPVAGLALDRRRAGGQGRAQARLAQRLEGGVVGGPRGGDRPKDPAAGVRRPLEPGRSLVGAIAGEDRMGVAVDEARRDQCGAEVDARVVGWRVSGRADPRDPALTDLDRPRRDPRGRQATTAGQEHRARANMLAA